MPDNSLFDPKLIKPILDYVDILIKPSLKEVGGIIGDEVKFWRYKNQLRIVKRAKELHEKNNIEVRSIPVKTLGTLLDSASYEEDETIIEKWAHLLANATNSKNEYNSHFTLVSVLKELTPDDVMVLDFMYTNSPNYRSEYDISILRQISYRDKSFHYDFKEDREREEVIVDNLVRLNLVEKTSGKVKESRTYGVNPVPKYFIETPSDMKLTSLGWRLAKECKM